MVKVLYSFVLTAWITCLVAALEVYCSKCKQFNEELLETSSGDRDENFERAVRRYIPWHTSRFGRFCCYAKRKLLCLIIVEWPRTRTGAKACLDNFCNVQVATSCAVMVAAVVQIDSMSFYHQQLIMNYWFLAMASFWAARAGNLNQVDDEDTWHYWTRTTAIFLTTVLATAFHIIVIPRQWHIWDPLQSKHCFIGHVWTGYGQNFVWIAGQIVYAFYLLCLPCIFLASRTRTWKNATTVAGWIQGSTSKSRKYPLKPHPASFCSIKWIWLGLILPMIIIFWWFARMFFALWAWGDPISAWIVLAYFGFAAWNTYDIFDLKLSNVGLVQNETAWGFGQVLPMVLLGLTILSIFDAAQSR
jgi:hypothetical protein